MNDFNPYEAPQNLSSEKINKTCTRKLNAKTSLLVFISYFGTQIFSGILAGIAFAIYFVVKNSGFNSESFQLFFKEFTLPILIFSLLSSGIVMLFLSLRYSRGFFKDRSPTGIALHPGKGKNILFSIILGTLIALIYSSIAVFIYPPDPEAEVGPLTEMLLSPGANRIFWIFLALFFAPFIEEFLFRGVMLAGFTYSLGLKKAAIIITFLFVIIHAFEAIHYPPAFGGIALIAIATLFLRLKYKALGPAVAAHFGYNGVIALAALASG